MSFLKTRQTFKLLSLLEDNAIGSPFSLRHVIVGVGEPLAAHLKVTLLLSLTTISVLVG